MMLKNDWLWDRKITINKARLILKDPANSHFLSISATLLARKNTPNEVFKYYLKPLDFLKNWRAIKRQMRKDNWNDPRIEFWQAIYEALREKFRKRGVDLKEETPSIIREENDFCKTIAEKIKIARKQKGLSQRELAKRLEVSQQMVSRIEKGRENIYLLTINNITEALGTEVHIEIL